MQEKTAKAIDANQAADALEESVKTRPMTPLLGEVAVGFVIGAIWKR